MVDIEITFIRQILKTILVLNSINYLIQYNKALYRMIIKEAKLND